MVRSHSWIVFPSGGTRLTGVLKGRLGRLAHRCAAVFVVLLPGRCSGTIPVDRVHWVLFRCPNRRTPRPALFGRFLRQALWLLCSEATKQAHSLCGCPVSTKSRQSHFVPAAFFCREAGKVSAGLSSAGRASSLTDVLRICSRCPLFMNGNRGNPRTMPP